MKPLIENNGFKEIAQQLTDPVLMTDAHGYTIWTNTAFETLCGHTQEEMLGCKPGHVLQGKRTDLATARALSQAVIHGKDIQVDILNYHKDGTPYWINTAINPIRDDNNTLTGFIAIERESTQKHHEVESLQEQVIHVYNALLLSENANCQSLLIPENLKLLTG